MADVDVVNSTSAGLDVLVQPKGIAAFLPLFHLSDYPSHWKSLLSMNGPITGKTSEPRRLTDVLYYGQNKDKSHVSLTILRLTLVVLGKRHHFRIIF